MLPGDRRLRRSGEFTAVMKAGVRAGTPSLVVHIRRTEQENPPGATRVGFVVSKQVGNAVVRNRVKRRLRHLIMGLSAPVTADVVVRALPAAASQPERLSSDLRIAWQRAFSKAVA